MKNEEKLQKKLQKLQQKEQKIVAKINKKLKNYQERDDKEQMIWVRENAPKEGENSADFYSEKNAKKIAKKSRINDKKLNKKILNDEKIAENSLSNDEIFDFFTPQNDEFLHENNTQPFEQTSTIQQEKFAAEPSQFVDENSQNNYQNITSEISQKTALQREVFAPQNISSEPEKSTKKPQKQAGFAPQNEYAQAENKNTKKITEKSKKIAEKPEKIIIKSTEQVQKPQKIERNAYNYYEQETPAWAASSLSDEKQNEDTKANAESLRAENEKLKKENAEIKEKNKSLNRRVFTAKQRENNFIYVEDLSRQNDKKKDDRIAELEAEQVRTAEMQKKKDFEDEVRQDKINDLVRQQKDLTYSMGLIEDKIKDWAEISEDAYLHAMARRSWFAISGGHEKSFLGVTYSDILMGMSVGAMATSLSYQKDLQLEREKFMQKQKELQR